MSNLETRLPFKCQPKKAPNPNHFEQLPGRQVLRRSGRSGGYDGLPAKEPPDPAERGLRGSDSGLGRTDSETHPCRYSDGRIAPVTPWHTCHVAMGQNPNRTPSEHLNPHKSRLKWVQLSQNGTIGFEIWPRVLFEGLFDAFQGSQQKSPSFRGGALNFETPTLPHLCRA